VIGKGRVLVVDDNESVRAMLGAGLEKLGWTVMLSVTGEGVSAQIKAQCVDAVLLDIVMADKEGMETLMEIKAASPALPVIMISSHIDYLQMAKSMGADETLVKPLNIDEIDEILSTLLGAPEGS